MPQRSTTMTDSEPVSSAFSPEPTPGSTLSLDESRRTFTRIRGRFSEARRLPRIGKIRLGLKARNAKGVEYPTETPYFVVPEEVAAVYGQEPRELDVMIPVENPEVFFPQKLARYGRNGLLCHGDGVEAMERKTESSEFAPRACPCPELDKGNCGETSHLLVILPRVTMGGVYQITTGSYHSTIDLNSAIDYVKALLGRVAMVPLKLRRVPRETLYQGKKATHYTLNLVLDADIRQVNALRQDTERILLSLPAAVDEPSEAGPLADPPDLYIPNGQPDEGVAGPARGALDDWRPGDPAAHTSVRAPLATTTSVPPQAENAGADLTLRAEDLWIALVDKVQELQRTGPGQQKLVELFKAFKVTGISHIHPEQRAYFYEQIKDLDYPVEGGR